MPRDRFPVTRSARPARAVVCALVLGLAAAGGAIADPPGTVSPGGLDRSTAAASACPTFSWTSAPAASGYELVVLAIAAGTEPEVALRETIAGSASSWSPDGSRCLAPGEYGWSVRALGADPVPSHDEARWAPVRRFSVAGLPSPSELATALETLRRWQAGQAGGDVADATQRPQDPRPGQGTRRAAIGANGGGAAGAALRGDNPATTGLEHGTFGLTSSPQGAGLAAVNRSGGPDLLLDGAAQGQADAHLAQDSLDRPSANPETFDFRNSGDGAMTLRVDGVDVVTSATDRDTLGALGCGEGQIARRLGAGWQCSTDAGSTYAAGNQLSLAGDTFHVVEGPGSGLDADTLDGVEGADLQRRISGSCPPWHVIAAVSSDGSLVCLEAGRPPKLTSVDTAGDRGLYTSIAIGEDGNPVISYQLRTSSSGVLMVARCLAPDCRTATTTPVDANGDVGRWSSIALGLRFPVIAYQEEAGRDLRLAQCENAACTQARITTLASQGNVGAFSSLAIEAHGEPIVAFLDDTLVGARQLKLARCVDPDCGAVEIQTVDATGSAGAWASLAVGLDGNPVIAYSDETNSAYDLKVAKCHDPACSAVTLTVLDAPGFTGSDTSIAIGADGNPVISYASDTSLKVARCQNPACTAATQSIVDGFGTGAWNSSIAIGVDGLPVISYYSRTPGDLRLARCLDASCSTATITALDTAGDVGLWSSVAIGADGTPVVSYRDATNLDLKVARCRSMDCQVD